MGDLRSTPRLPDRPVPASTLAQAKPSKLVPASMICAQPYAPRAIRGRLIRRAPAQVVDADHDRLDGSRGEPVDARVLRQMTNTGANPPPGVLKLVVWPW